MELAGGGCNIEGKFTHNLCQTTSISEITFLLVIPLTKKKFHELVY